MKPNKLLGQNFLTSPEIAHKIVDAAELSSDDTVLEVGPGKGTLTELLLQKAGKVIAVEKDVRLVEYLRETFPDAHNLEIVHGDILKPTTYNLTPNTYKLVANIPYYLTSRLFRLFLEDVPRKPERMILMVQKEVAERIVAQPPHMNLLGLSVQAFAKPKILFKVSPGSFSPPPEVDSAVVDIAHISDEFFKKNTITPQDFFAAPKKAFSQKRKMLRNSLGLYPEHPLATKRPQELSLEEWTRIGYDVLSPQEEKLVEKGFAQLKRGEYIAWNKLK